MTPAQITEKISRIIGRPIAYAEIPADAFREYNEILAGVFQWYSDGGHKADLPSVRRLLPGVTDFDTWAAQQGREKFEALFSGD
ncbi:hypothetical protein QWJ34_16725 [Saccharibacillus sp. CPCC 101409]|uniref:hypothetical protein n=1 Tax=Saccharibacillus sp. CPCC 101409 TaxID=3058041 RepID=UPI00267282A1|nr:hypothetical protein [Saccharibacillus sp. CPCC 101409]MDO3411412.1 hypothetical protein [Saccharibacillus sp. CPCC 101409]